MDHAINGLRGYMQATIDMYRDMDLTQKEVRTEMKAYVDALNKLEIYYYDEKQTSLDSVLSNFRK